MRELPLTPDEVEDRAHRFQDLLARERELQEQLLSLQIRGDRNRTAELLNWHDAAIAEIERIRTEEMLPILMEIAAYLQVARELDLIEQP